MPILVALALGLLLTPALGRLGLRAGLVDRPLPDGLKIHVEPKPLTGGIGVVAAILVAAALAGVGLEPLVIAAILLLMAVGVADDMLGLPPLARLAAELAAGGLLAAGGITFEALGDLGPAAVVVGTPAVVNAVNVVDGQDGLAGGLATLAAAGLTLVAVAEGLPGDLGWVLVAALLGFLVWNRPPASVFLGDGGAYAVGGVLVILAASASSTPRGLLGAAVCLVVFGLELGSTMVRRAVTKASLVSGDRAHAYDLLAALLGSRHRSTAVMLSAGLAGAGLGWLVSRIPPPGGSAILLTVVGAGSLGIAALWRAQGARLRRTR